MKEDKKFYTTEYYLIDPARGDYEVLKMRDLQKKLNKGESFIKKHGNSEELFEVNGRGYILTKNFGSVWNLI